jgi:hypothetical protein
MSIPLSILDANNEIIKSSFYLSGRLFRKNVTEEKRKDEK